MTNLVNEKRVSIEDHFLSPQGWSHLGLILAHTKIDTDNPTLREWCLLFIRNITSWSDKVRDKLSKLTMIDDQNPYDTESQKAFDALGKPM